MHAITIKHERGLFDERTEGSLCFIGAWYEIPGTLDAARLRRAIGQTLARQSSCRTSFRRGADRVSQMVVGDDAGFHFHVLPVAKIDAGTIEATVSAHLSRLERSDDVPPDDGSDIHRFFLLDTGGGGQALVLCQPQAVSDRYALDRIAAEIAGFYTDPETVMRAAAASDQVAPASGTETQDEAFWRDMMQDVGEVPRFHRNLTPQGVPPGRISRELCPETARALCQPPPELTMFPMLAAGFAAQIAGQTRQQDIVFAIRGACQYGLAGHAVAGPLSNGIPIRVTVDPGEIFATFAARFQTTIREALRHQRPGDHRIRQITDVRPDFALSLWPPAPPLRFGTLEAGPRRFLAGAEYGVEICWHLDVKNNLSVDAYFDAGEIGSDRIPAFLDRCIAISSAAARTPQSRICDLLRDSQVAPRSPAPPEQDTAAPRRLFALFEAAATAHTDRPAVRFEGQEIRYSALLAQVEQRAAMLHARGVRAGMKVAFLAERNPGFVRDMLALSRLGVAFAALDAEYPLSRLVELQNALNCDVVIGCASRQPKLLNGMQAAGVSILDAGTDDGPILSPAPYPPAPAAQDVAYYLFTSGTTGTPKTIGVGHGALPHFLTWQARTFGITCSDSVSMMSGLAHDPVLRDVFLPLLHGALLTIPGQPILRNPRELERWLQQEMPRIIHTTPAMGQVLSEITAGKPHLHGARLIFWGGDMLPGDLVRQVAHANPDLTQVNFYGSTETPQAVLYYCHGPDDPPFKVLPVGHPAAGVSVDIVDEAGRPLDINELGEVQVRTSYHVEIAGSPPASAAGGQIYRSGDLGYRLPNGAIQLVGRQDDQVSVRGYRVELSDVERHLMQTDGVTAACVLPEKDAQGRTFLFAHVVLDKSANPDTGALRSRMSAAVPSYMIPAVFLAHDSLPMLPNGKRNRTALRAMQRDYKGGPAPEVAAGITAMPSRFTPGERAVVRIFEEATGLKVAHSGQSFVGLGADSLNYIQAMLRLEPIIPDLPEDWQNRSIADLGRMIQVTAESANAVRLSPFRMVQAELPVVFRAAAILAIVALHFRVGSIGGGATFIIFMLTGYSFARFQMPKIISDGSAKGILKTLMPVVIAAFSVGCLMGVAKYIQDEPFSLASILFLTNFLDFTADSGDAGGIIWLWFIACYVQIMLLIAFFLSFSSVRDFLRRNMTTAMVIMLLASTVVKFGLPWLVNPSFLFDGIPVNTPWNYLPTTHFPTVILGGIVYLSVSGSMSKSMCMILTFLYAMIVGSSFSYNQPGLFIVAVFTMLFVRSVLLPYVLYRAILLVSGASLYIYLLHVPLLSLFRAIGVNMHPIGSFIVIISGIIFLGMTLKKLECIARDTSRNYGQQP